MGVYSPGGKQGQWYFEFKYKGVRHTGRVRGLWPTKQQAITQFEKQKAEIKARVDQESSQVMVGNIQQAKINEVKKTQGHSLTLALELDMGTITGLVESGVTVLTFKLMG